MEKGFSSHRTASPVRASGEMARELAGLMTCQNKMVPTLKISDRFHVYIQT
jgi:hypothetical protein